MAIIILIPTVTLSLSLNLHQVEKCDASVNFTLFLANGYPETRRA